VMGLWSPNPSPWFIASRVILSNILSLH
jgi:hypothetical protein